MSDVPTLNDWIHDLRSASEEFGGSGTRLNPQDCQRLASILVAARAVVEAVRQQHAQEIRSCIPHALVHCWRCTDDALAAYDAATGRDANVATQRRNNSES